MTIDNIPRFSISPQAAVQVLLQVRQYLLEVLVNNLLALGNDRRPNVGHGQLDARTRVVLVAVESRHEGGKVGGELGLGLGGYVAKSKGSTLYMEYENAQQN